MALTQELQDEEMAAAQHVEFKGVRGTQCDGISFAGFTRLIELLSSDLSEKLFNEEAARRLMTTIDTSGDGTLSLEELEQFMELLSGGKVEDDPEDQSTTEPKEDRRAALARSLSTRDVELTMPSSPVSSDAQAPEADLDIDFKAWQMLYCGGSAPVVQVLHDMEHSLGIATKIESFDW